VCNLREAKLDIVEIAPEPALLLKYSDEGRHAYMQSYPFLSGPRQELNQLILDGLPDALTVRRPTQTCKIERLSNRESRLPPEIEARARALFKEARVGDEEIAEAFSKIAWKCREIPQQARSILDIGCGGGMELVFLRALAPNSRILAIDWTDKVPARLKEVAQIEFRQRHVVEFLATSQEKFDIVFSNHVLEHMYDPDVVLKQIRDLLVSDGLMLAGLPLDGWGGFAPTMRNRPTQGLASIDLGEFDFGHPWKTTASDLRETTISAGFGIVRLAQREGRLNVKTVGDEVRLSQRKARGERLRRVVLGPLRGVLLSAFGLHPPQPFTRLFYGLERRVWFGSNNLKNSTVPEVLLMAQRAEQSAPH